MIATTPTKIDKSCFLVNFSLKIILPEIDNSIVDSPQTDGFNTIASINEFAIVLKY